VNLPVVVPDREQLTEAEARRIGLAAMRLVQLKDLRTHASRGATFTVATGSYGGNVSFSIGSLDAEACIALLIEREAAFLTSFNVKLDETPK
jgi:hypothetical protein